MEQMEHHETQDDVRRAPELEALGLADKPDGPAAAAIMAAGIGVLVLGIMTTLSEASSGFKEWLQNWDFDQGVGELAGKTTIAVIVWLVSWVVLAIGMRGKEVNLKAWFWVALFLGILGAVGTFPTFFQAFE